MAYLKKQRDDIERKERLEGNLKRLDGQRRHGRPIMTKSFLQKDKKSAETKDVLSPEEIDKQLYFTVRFN